MNNKLKQIVSKAIVSIIKEKEEWRDDTFMNKMIYGHHIKPVSYKENKEYKILIDYLYNKNKEYKQLPIIWVFEIENIEGFEKFENLDQIEINIYNEDETKRLKNNHLSPELKSLIKNAGDMLKAMPNQSSTQTGVYYNG